MATPEQVIKAKEKVMTGEGFLYIKKVPRNTVDEFLTYANNVKEFNKDWGMAFKIIWDTYKGLMPRSDEAIQSQFEALYAKIEQLETTLYTLTQKKDSPDIKTMGGAQIKKG